MGKIIVISNQKGGCGKSATTASLGFGLARQGKRVLLLDADPQHTLTFSLGVTNPGKLPFTLTSAMKNIIKTIDTDIDFDASAGIIRHAEGVDFLPTNSTLSDMELSLVPIMGRETILRQYIDTIKHQYDYILIDTNPSLGLLTVNALAAADRVIVPVMPLVADAKGLELLLITISKIQKQINPQLSIGGILFTKVEKCTNLAQDTISVIETAYGGKIHIFGEHIPKSVRAAETCKYGISIFAYDPKGKVAAAYSALTKEVLACG